MRAPTDRRSTLRTARLLHRPATPANGKRVPVGAAVPVTRALELARHGRHHLAHLVVGDGAVEGAAAEHLVDLFDFGGRDRAGRAGVLGYCVAGGLQVFVGAVAQVEVGVGESGLSGFVLVRTWKEDA